MHCTPRRGVRVVHTRPRISTRVPTTLESKRRCAQSGIGHLVLTIQLLLLSIRRRLFLRARGLQFLSQKRLLVGTPAVSSALRPEMSLQLQKPERERDDDVISKAKTQQARFQDRCDASG